MSQLRATVRAAPTGCVALLGLLLLTVCSHAYTPPAVSDFGDGDGASSQDPFDRAARIYLPLAEALDVQNGYPRSITNGSTWMPGSSRNWTSGFFSGVLWQLYERTGDDAFRMQAETWMLALANETTNPTHDVGFIINSSFGRGYRLTGDPWYRDVLLEAAQHLATRYDPDVRAIRSWGEMRQFAFPVAVDGMMNIELLFWAAKNGGDPALADIAWQHARTIMIDHVRPDGSTYHVVDYDPVSGATLWKGTVQGLSDTSMWARGQAWAIYGFSMATRETGDPTFLWTAEKTADAFLDGLPDDLTPFWDFDAASIPGEPRDASAAAIAASGLWELSTLTGDPAKRSRYRTASYSLVERLCAGDCSAEGVGMPALLDHSTGNRPLGAEVDVPVIYAEYYFLEALARQRPHSAVPVAMRDAARRGETEGEAGEESATLGVASNPFRPPIEFHPVLHEGGPGTIRVYDPGGRLVRSLPLPSLDAGRESVVVWDGNDDRGRRVAPGVYLVRLAARGSEVVRKVVLLR